MKKVIIVFFCLFITGCSLSKKDVFMGKEHLPVQTDNVLQSQSTEDIRQLYGEPLSVRTEEPNMLWTYYENKCTRLIYFNQKGRVCYAETRGQNCEPAPSQSQITQ